MKLTYTSSEFPHRVFYEPYYGVAEDHTSTTHISFPRGHVHSCELPVGLVLYWTDVEAGEGVSWKGWLMESREVDVELG